MPSLKNNNRVIKTGWPIFSFFFLICDMFIYCSGHRPIAMGFNKINTKFRTFKQHIIQGKDGEGEGVVVWSWRGIHSTTKSQSGRFEMNGLFETAQSIVTERFVLALADLSDSFSQSVLSRKTRRWLMHRSDYPRYDITGWAISLDSQCLKTDTVKYVKLIGMYHNVSWLVS